MPQRFDAIRGLTMKDGIAAIDEAFRSWDGADGCMRVLAGLQPVTI